jgi:tight adherence protein B
MVVFVGVLTTRRGILAGGAASLVPRLSPSNSWRSAAPVTGRGPALLVASVVGLLSGSVLVAFSMFAVGVGVAPSIEAAMLRRREVRQFRVSLPVFVEEFARGLRGGLSPAQALLDGAHAAPFPFPEAFLPAATLMRAGASADEAVSAWASSRDDSSLHFLATAMAVGGAVGGIDGRSADAVAVALRERRAMDDVVRVQATQALYSAGVLSGAPVVFCALVVLSDERSSAFLLRNPVGLVLGTTGVVLDLVGAGWMRRLVRRAVR